MKGAQLQNEGKKKILTDCSSKLKNNYTHITL